MPPTSVVIRSEEYYQPPNWQTLQRKTLAWLKTIWTVIWCARVAKNLSCNCLQKQRWQMIVLNKRFTAQFMSKLLLLNKIGPSVYSRQVRQFANQIYWMSSCQLRTSNSMPASTIMIIKSMCKELKQMMKLKTNSFLIWNRGSMTFLTMRMFMWWVSLIQATPSTNESLASFWTDASVPKYSKATFPRQLERSQQVPTALTKSI